MKGVKLTEDQNYLIECLAVVFGGMHHVPKIQVWGTGIAVNYYGTLSTYDSNTLTELVIMAHQKAVRVEIGSCNFNNIRIVLHRRKHQQEGEKLAWHERHPSTSDLIEKLKGQP